MCCAEFAVNPSPVMEPTQDAPLERPPALPQIELVTAPPLQLNDDPQAGAMTKSGQVF